MADETPTLRLGAQGSDQDAEHWAHLMLNDQYAGTVLDATAECIAALAAALRQPRCGDRMDSVLNDSPALVCDLAFGHPGKWHGADQFSAGISSRCEWTTTAEQEDELAALRSRLTEVERQRDEAIAHDRQPYPTADAFEAVCHALRKHRAIADRATALLVSEGAYDVAETYRLRAEFAAQVTDRPEATSLANRLTAAEPVVEAAVAWLRIYQDEHTTADLRTPWEALVAAVDLYSSTVHPPTPETPK